MRNLAGKVALFSWISACAFAQEKPAASPELVTPPTFKQVFLYQFDQTEKKLLDLAEAIPESKYSWRPAESVRSISETFVHEAAANPYFLSFLGVKPPAGITGKSETTIKDKAGVIAIMKKSFALSRESVAALTEDDMMKATKFMGGGMQTYQSVLFFMSDHMHEHLGQLIAYARSNGVTPPWSKGKDN